MANKSWEYNFKNYNPTDLLCLNDLHYTIH